MTKNQLREVIRHLIKKELLNEALLLHPVQAAYMRGYEDGEQGKPEQAAYVRGYKDGEQGKPANIQSVEDLQLYENQWEPEIAEPDIDTDTEKGRPLIAPGAPEEEGDDEEYDEPFKAEKIDDIRRKIINRLKNKM
jgi:hypothetical protein